ncbi:MAG TPA: hypothetical protein VFQ85_02015 [Mycobacteriales bacterium]|jgi:hypothetical protein|nr:hypothetical protein [Mycobacteriales bacterium]
MSDKLAELRSRTDEELVALHDAAAEHTIVGVSYYLEELARRDTVRSGDRIEALTAQVTRLTTIITWLTALNAAAAVVGVVVALLG